MKEMTEAKSEEQERRTRARSKSEERKTKGGEEQKKARFGMESAKRAESTSAYIVERRRSVTERNIQKRRAKSKSKSEEKKQRATGATWRARRVESSCGVLRQQQQHESDERVESGERAESGCSVL